jgi:biofilm PGA synthesis N-glycosyltransferase PgaC
MVDVMDKRNPSFAIPRIALVTPLRDEEGFIEDMIASIAAQDIRPAKWIIVDDGSTDRTPDIVREQSRSLGFIELLQLPPRSERRPGGEGAIAAALQALELDQFDYLARFDADLLFERDYLSLMLGEFTKDPRLGIAGGSLYILREGALVPERAPEYHVRGALKMYRRECFKQIGGLGTEIGWDTIDEVCAWSKGWRTRSFKDIRVIHRRPTGGGMLATKIYRERGRAEYLTWSHPVFVLLKTAKIALRSPINAAHFLSAFAGCYRAQEARLQDPQFKETRRTQQKARVFGKVIPGGMKPAKYCALTDPTEH